MNLRQWFTACGAAALLLGLTGCGETTPEKVEAWTAKGNTKQLIATLSDRRQFIRIAAIDALAKINDPATIEPLAKLLDDDDQFIVHKTLKVLAEMDDPAVLPYMIRMLGYETAEARITAATALGNRQSIMAVEPLIALLNDQHETVVVAAETALGQIGDARAIEPLIKQIESRSFDIRLAAVTALSKLGGLEAMEGLLAAMGDMSPRIRETAVESLIGAGAISVTPALTALRSESHFARASGVAVLNALNAVPQSGNDRVWYEIARLTSDERTVIDIDQARKLADVKGGVEALIEAAASENSDMRDYGCLALESLGTDAVEKVKEAALRKAGPVGAAWFAERSKWPGAPAWELDLWGAAASLNPRFEINPRIMSHLEELHSQNARQLLDSSTFMAEKQYIPQLIGQFATLDSKKTGGETITFFGLEFTTGDVRYSAEESQFKLDVKLAVDCRRMAREHLIRAGHHAYLPLIAALNDEDLSIVGWSAVTLDRIASDRAEPYIISAFNDRLESGAVLESSPLYSAIQMIERPAIQALVPKVRPDYRRAIRVAEARYPGTEFTNVKLDAELDPKLQATMAPFKLLYTDHGRKRILRVLFQLDENGNWVPNPPLPDTLPE